MSFDSSRFSFDPRQNFLGVVMQQGRVQLDADWNEWAAQLTRRIQAGTLDSLGRAAVPRETPDAFRISWDGDGLRIGLGRAYVDGILVENHGQPAAGWNPQLGEPAGAGPLTYAGQPYLPSPPDLPKSAGPHLVYLDVWRRDLTALQCPGLVEKAIGVDTTGRWQLVWQVKVLPGDWTGGTCVGADLDPGALPAALRPSAGRLSVGTADLPGAVTPCEIPPAAGYKGLENQLYRVEIHTGGAIGTATFKWSRDNATVASRVAAIPAADRLVVESLGRDALLGFHNGDWGEITDRRRELANLPGELRRIRTDGGVDDATRTLVLAAALPAGAFAISADPDDYCLVRRWDQAGNQYRADGSVLVDLDAAAATGAIPVPAAGTRVFLEQGILVGFDLVGVPADGVFRAGDYWTFSARSADASVEQLDQAPPQGIHHHYAPLAVISRPNRADDQRTPFNPSTGSLQVCSVVANDGLGSILALRPGQSLPLDRLAAGLAVLVRQRLDTNSVNDGSLFVTTEVPYRLPGAYSGAPVGPVVAYQPVVLPAEVTLPAQGALTWNPYPQTLGFLGDLLAQDVARLGNISFQTEFQAFDHGGPPSQWGLAPGNLVVQTAAAAGTAVGTAAPATALPTTAIHRYQLKDGASYVGVSAELIGSGTVGLIYDWQDDANYALFFMQQAWQAIGYSGGANYVTLGHARVQKGVLFQPATREYTITVTQSNATGLSLDLKQTADGLQFGGRATFGTSGYAVEQQNLSWPGLTRAFRAGTHLGLLTAGIGTARLTRLQVNYPGQAPVTLVPAGVAKRLLARLVLKRSLLAVATDTAGTAPSGVFSGPVPEADFETWFWITPATPNYGYGYGYGAGSGFFGIGLERLLRGVP
jgi:hypothetical protein